MAHKWLTDSEVEQLSILFAPSDLGVHGMIGRLIADRLEMQELLALLTAHEDVGIAHVESSGRWCRYCDWHSDVFSLEPEHTEKCPITRTREMLEETGWEERS